MEGNRKAVFFCFSNMLLQTIPFSVMLSFFLLWEKALFIKKITFCLMLMTCTGLMWTILLHSFHFISSLNSAALLAVLRKCCRKAPTATPIDHQTYWIITAPCDVVFYIWIPFPKLTETLSMNIRKWEIYCLFEEAFWHLAVCFWQAVYYVMEKWSTSALCYLHCSFFSQGPLIFVIKSILHVTFKGKVVLI